METVVATDAPGVVTVRGEGPYAGREVELMISAEKIQARVAELAHELSRRYEGRGPIIIGILNGSFVFMADLARHLTIPFEVDFIKLSSYEGGTSSKGTVRLLKDISADITGRDVIVVEDIIDTGLTINFLRRRLEEAGPTSVTFVTLLLKDEVAKLDFLIDYVGFNIPNRFVVGYGLDIDQQMRGLTAIYALKEQ